MVYLSSDAIFDGTKGNYGESDEPLPVTFYGENLAVLEPLVSHLCKNACIIRPSYLYGVSVGELGPRLSGVRQRLLAGEAVYYAQDMFKSPMEVGLAAEAVVKLALTGVTGIVHISGARTSVYNFYQDAMRVLGVPTETLHANTLPADAAASQNTVPGDTSLNATLMTRLTGVPVLSVGEALTAKNG